MKRVSLSIYDYNHKKLCDLYDSNTQAEGQAYDIVYKEELNGWKEISFSLPPTSFRWNFIKSEYLLRLKIGTATDWFIIHTPKKTRGNRFVGQEVSCSHLSSILKTKNLYLAFDDENGIGTADYLLGQILANTGWSIGTCDTFYERDGFSESGEKVVKQRSLKTESKVGSYQLINELCGLFNAYPVFHGDTKTVDLHALNDRDIMETRELYIGKNLDSLSVEYDSESIVTRLYVEGEYGDYGYVGIDDVNPTGLSYLLNFDYYKEIGVFTDEHQKALDAYLKNMKEATAKIMAKTAEINEKETELNGLWGQIPYVIYKVENGQIVNDSAGNPAAVYGGGATLEDREIKQGDNLVVLYTAKRDGVVEDTPVEQCAYETVDDNKQFTIPAGSTYVLKYASKSKSNSLIGAKECAIEAKLKRLETITKKYEDPDTGESAKKEYEKEITSIRAELAKIRFGVEAQPAQDATEDQEAIPAQEAIEGLYSMVHRAVALALEIDNLKNKGADSQAGLLQTQAQIEANFMNAMGDMLKDGYWSDSNYTVGQERFLYEDAVDVMKQVSRPSVSYTMSLVPLSEAMGYTEGNLTLNCRARVYDTELGVNDIVYVKSVTRYLDDPSKDSAEVSNEDVLMSGKTFDSVLSRITRLSDMVYQKNSLYSRAGAINGDGSIAIDRLEGQLDILKNKLLFSRSGWYTDDNGNIILESATGQSAMLLSGEGLMIAYGKDDEGAWNWRTCGTGEGLVADTITTGFLSSDRIRAGSITANKLASDVGQSLDLSSNKSITMIVEDAIPKAIEEMTDQFGVTLTLTADNGIYLDNILTQTTITPMVTRNGANITNSLGADSFTWTRKTYRTYEKEIGLRAGGISPTNGEDVNPDEVTIASTATAYCNVYYPIAEYRIGITPIEGLKYAIYGYDDSNKYVGWTGWTIGRTYTLPAETTKVRFSLGFEDERDITDENISSLKKVINVTEIAKTDEAWRPKHPAGDPYSIILTTEDVDFHAVFSCSLQYTTVGTSFDVDHNNELSYYRSGDYKGGEFAIEDGQLVVYSAGKIQYSIDGAELYTDTLGEVHSVTTNMTIVDRTDDTYNAELLSQTRSNFEVLSAKINSEVATLDDKLSSRIEQTTTSITQTFTEQAEEIDGRLGSLETYIRTDASGMEIGKSNSRFKTKIDNEKLAFLEGDEEIAYISNNRMYITEANVTNKLTVGAKALGGVWEWEAVTAGMGLKYKRT